MVPGFDFLQGLVKNAGTTLPGLGQWVAPTLDPQELGKRIEELKTVQFWLEQNARMIGTTVQALEVQRMTLSTLKTMNLQVADLAQAFKLKDPAPADPAPPPPAAPARAQPDSTARTAQAAPPAAKAGPARASGGEADPAPGVVDPMQWWGALTQQFTQLAAQALKDGSVEAAGQLAGAMAKSSAEAVGQALQQAGRPAPKPARGRASAAGQSAAAAPRPARKSAPTAAREAPGRTVKRKA
jgi:hypothetical protein